jgi:hypothetical protein
MMHLLQGTTQIWQVACRFPRAAKRGETAKHKGNKNLCEEDNLEHICRGGRSRADAADAVDGATAIWLLTTRGLV